MFIKYYTFIHIALETCQKCCALPMSCGTMSNDEAEDPSSTRYRSNSTHDSSGFTSHITGKPTASTDHVNLRRELTQRPLLRFPNPGGSRNRPLST